MGLGRFGGGIAAVHYLVHQQAVVTVTDQLPHQQLQKSLQQIKDLPIAHTFFGGHPPEAFADCELLIVNPAVKPDHPVLKLCDKLAIPVMTEIQLLLLHLQSRGDQLRNNLSFEQTPAVGATPTQQTSTAEGSASNSVTPWATVVAVTGSNGKSTTATLIQHLLTSEFESPDASIDPNSNYSSKPTVSDSAVAQIQKSSHTSPPKRKCWLGGNIGGSLLAEVDQINQGDVVVLELSSFQLHYLQHFDFAPDVAVLTGFSPNHLNWHPNLQHYQQSKQNLFRRQHRQQAAVLPEAHSTNGQRIFSPKHDEIDQPTWRIRCKEFRFGTVDDGLEGVFWEDNWLIVRRNGVEDAVRISLPTSLSGTHNLHNLTAAACAAVLVGADPMKFSTSVRKFAGLPYRLSISGQQKHIQLVNDSASTTPESAIAAVQTMRQRLIDQGSRFSAAEKGRLVAIAGGADKGSDLTELAKQLAQHADAVVAIGSVGESLAQLIRQHSESVCKQVIVADDFCAAFRQAVELVASTGIVLLSPGCSSFGWFRDYVDRGQQFDSLVEQWIQR